MTSAMPSIMHQSRTGTTAVLVSGKNPVLSAKVIGACMLVAKILATISVPLAAWLCECVSGLAWLAG
jgi:hypothetical protein